MTEAEKNQIKEEIRRYQAMIDNDPNGKETKNWEQRVRNLEARLTF